jgi:Flp pilus assembly protein TadD
LLFLRLIASPARLSYVKRSRKHSYQRGRRVSASFACLILAVLSCLSASPRLALGKALRVSNSQDANAVLRDAGHALEQHHSEAALRILQSLSPGDCASHFQAGAMLAKHNLYAAAAREFGLARHTSSDSYVAGYNQSLAYLNAGNYQAALRTANELFKEGHQTAELANVAATAYLRNGQPKEAYNALRFATHLDPRNEEAYVELCEMALEHDNYDRGLEIANIGLRHLPTSSRLYLQRGIIRAMKGQFDEAESDFSRASELSSQEVLPAVSLGLIAMQKGNLEKAVETLRRTAAEHPGNYLAQYWFAEALLRAGAEPGTRRRDEALAALKASVRSNPDYWHARAELGKLLLDRDEVDGAIAELQEAAHLNPSATGPLYLLAQAYRRKGDEVRAKELLAQVSTMQAQDRESMAQSGLRQLAREGQASLGGSQRRAASGTR